MKENNNNNNGNDTNVGSIEEDVKSINKGLYELEDSYELHQARWAKRIFENIKEKMEHILSDYKKLQEEFKAVDHECSRLERKEVEMEKIIDLMAEFIEDGFTVDKFCTKKGCYADNYINGHCEKCLNCIKQYFINKAKEVK